MTSLGRVGRILAGSIDVSIEQNTPASYSASIQAPVQPTPSVQSASQSPAMQDVQQPHSSSDVSGSTVTLVAGSEYSDSARGSSPPLIEQVRQASPVQKISFNGEYQFAADQIHFSPIQC